MIRSLSIQEYLRSLPVTPLADVRTPLEFEQGHVPGAFNLPLFTNEERVEVGTTYKQVSREAAILLGFDLAGPKWSRFIKEALEQVPQKKIAVHCWRGGMRSGAMAWALDLYGFDVLLIQGGYKQYRRWALEQFTSRYDIRLVGGMTGSGKTRVLHELRRSGEQVIDLEQLAAHQGSAYGSMNRMMQPTQEQFENDLAFALGAIDPQRQVWMEDESSSIGKRIIPRSLWRQLQHAPLIELQVPEEDRVSALETEYGALDRQFLADCTERIRKRLGHEQTANALKAIGEERITDFIRIVLRYYDKTYRSGIAAREPGTVTPLVTGSADASANAMQLLSLFKTATT